MINKRIQLFLTMLLILLCLTPSQAYASKTSEDLEQEMKGIIEWKKGSVGISEDSNLLNNDFLKNAGDTVGDWYPIGIGRLGYKDDYAAYLAVIEDVVELRYKTAEKLSDMKSTEWHRIILAVLSLGGDPTQLGKDKAGTTINLIQDGTYDRGKTISLGAQGINGWIWGLIALDSMRYSVPENAYYSRDKIIEEILHLQLEDGGFSFYQDVADPDMTAMALQALAPYYNSEKTYSYVQQASNKKVVKTVRQVVDEALETLSLLQTANGDFKSWGTENAESTAQVIVALTALGIDPLTDIRFIKNGQDVLDGLYRYKMNDGGFIHAKTYNPENPTSLPDESNSMASEQVLYALTALYRFQNGYRSLYDFREEQPMELKKQIKSLNNAIDALPKQPQKEQLTTLFKQYLAVPVTERCYVYAYAKLAKEMEKQAIKNTSEPFATNMNETTQRKGAVTALLEESEFEKEAIFTIEDAEQVKAIPSSVTTEHYVEVTKLLQKLEHAENLKEYEDLLPKLQLKKQAIEAIEKEIQKLNEEILEELYPFNELTLKDKDSVERIVARFNKLSDYDQLQILNSEDVRKSKTQIENLYRARIIAVVLTVVVLIASIVVVVRVKKRRAQKRSAEEWYEE
ncbi:hypothetical protein MKZ17_09390 [Solibacillus sp. FSL R7-0682]|uniref:prenyltransferase/squalene oxidase repeat-containing protein n=1 Tax=Solibacillus sp. FSL R7-0682 TaxID=2921690 RepID=UPI0030FBBA9E